MAADVMGRLGRSVGRSFIRWGIRVSEFLSSSMAESSQASSVGFPSYRAKGQKTINVAPKRSSQWRTMDGDARSEYLSLKRSTTVLSIRTVVVALTWKIPALYSYVRRTVLVYSDFPSIRPRPLVRPKKRLRGQLLGLPGVVRSSHFGRWHYKCRRQTFLLKEAGKGHPFQNERWRLSRIFM